ncbi:UNVERIFIED_CONTAM: Far upstream element-binding protein 1 [Sesamum angustifolium]|uniref:Far upstream element-binding protein 1 n=1 Tax=Sesamum angustifolium TaxID=2727405 RepID=A0AAW2L3Y5_9LAMI
MAEEKVITSPEASPIAASAADGHKRKLEDMELNNAPQPLTDSEPKLDPDSLNNGDQDEENGGADESDTKRPRLDSNGDNVSEPDGLVPQNGHQEGGKEDEPKEEDSKQPEPAADSAQPAEGQEPREEPSEKINEEPASDENEKTQIGTTDDLERPKAEVEAPSEELPREGDVPVPSDEGQPGSDTQILSRKMEVPNDKVGVLIGKAGDTIRSLQDNSGAKIQIMRDADADPRSATRPLEIVGTLENINKAEKLIKDADAGGSPSLVARGFSTVQAASGGEQLEIQVPIEKVGLIIGKGGETIRNLQTRSGARIQLIQQNLSDGDQSRERTVRVTGNKKQLRLQEK